MSELKIDVSQGFEHLPRAPIIEAVIDIRARATIPWNEASVAESLKPQLSGYPQMVVRSQAVFDVTLMPGQSAQAREQDAWKGLQFGSQDGCNLAVFNRDGFTFSRLKPYRDWGHLQNEALRLWKIHAEAAKPAEIQRVGVRFINRIDLPLPPNPIQIEDYIKTCPSPPNGLDLPLSSFLHIDTFAVPGYPYTVNIIRTIQPPQPPRTSAMGLVLDIDVFVLEVMDISNSRLVEDRLAEMRWLKNKAFFGSITETIKQSFR